MNQEFTLPSGAKLKVSTAPFEDVADLRDAVISEVRAGGLKLPANIVDLDFAQFQNDSEMVGMLLDKALAVASSKPVQAALFKCFARAEYENVRVTKDLFDDNKLGDKAREDYFLIVSKVMEVNLKPFFKQISSVLKMPSKTATVAPA